MEYTQYKVFFCDLEIYECEEMDLNEIKKYIKKTIEENRELNKEDFAVYELRKDL